MQTQEYKIPYHGSYINDIRWKENDTKLEYMLLLRDIRSSEQEQGHLDPLNLLLPLVRRAYPDATRQAMVSFGNKNFTVIGTKGYARQIMVLYRHDFTWQVLLMDKRNFDQYQQEHPYYAEVKWDELPSY